MKEYYCSHDDSCLSGPSTATDSQTTPSPPAAKKPCSLPGKSTPLSNSELLVALVIKIVHACVCTQGLTYVRVCNRVVLYNYS